MAMRNPVGRANYQPNSFGEGPRESPKLGFTPFDEVESGPKRRLRAESFADHYSQARQFFISQTEGEQRHIAAALIFELSKVKTPVIRERVVSHLLNIDDTLANLVGTGLGLQAMPKAADAAVPTRQDLDRSAKLSIVQNGPQRFEGRKLGILVSDGADATLLKAIKAALAKEGATFEIIAPKVGGAKASDGSWIEARRYCTTPLRCCRGQMPSMICCRSRRYAISSPTLLRIASSSDMSKRLCRCSRKLALPRLISTRVLLRWRQQRMPPALSASSDSCVFGVASRASR